MRSVLILTFFFGMVHLADVAWAGYSHLHYNLPSVVPDSTVTEEDDGILFFDETLPDTIILLDDEGNIYTHEDSIIDSLKREVEKNTPLYIEDDSIIYIDDNSIQEDSAFQDIIVQGDSLLDDSVKNDSIIVLHDSVVGVNDTILGGQGVLVAHPEKSDSLAAPVMSAAEQMAEIERLARIKADSIVKADTAMIDFTKNMKYNDVKKYMTILPEEVKLPPEMQAILDRPNIPEGYERYTSYEDTIIVNPLFLPLTFNGNELDSTINFVQKRYENKSPYRLNDPIPDWLKKSMRQDSVNREIRRYAINYFTSTVKYDARFAPKAPEIKQVEAAGTLQDYVEVQKKEVKVEPVTTKKVTVSYWKTKMTSSLQFAQGSYTSNFGKNKDYINLTSSQVFRLDYNPFSKIEFHLDATWNLNLATAAGDTVRSIRIGNDQFSMNTSLGLKAFLKGWSYTLSSSFRTRFTNDYPTNSRDKTSGFLSPGFFSLGLGLTYNYQTKNQKFNISITGNPLSYQLNFVRHKDKDKINPQWHGIPHGNLSQAFGSSISASWGWQMFKTLRWDMWSQYNTNYEYVNFLFRNTFNLQLTKLLSTRFYIDTEYNDTWIPDHRYKHTRIYETLSFGFNYTW